MLFRQLFERESSTYTSEREYADLLRGFRLSNPKLMDIAVPRNLACGVA